MRLLLAALSLALLTAGCDPIGEARLVIADTSGAAIAGAAVVVTCPNRPAPIREQSGPDGKVVVHGIPEIDPACVFTVEKAGFVSKKLARSDVGYHKGIDDKAPPVKVVLDPAR
jgi:hypothetical protein